MRPRRGGLVVTSTWVAPGRVNLIGEHVDYNEGLVLPFALPFTTRATATRTADGRVHVRASGRGAASFAVDSAPDQVRGWLAYVAGCIWALRERGVRIPGLLLAIESDVPVGAGLSSSAALTCSVAAAVCDEVGHPLAPLELARVARVAENSFVGVSTGPMDQIASAISREGRATLLDCRTMETRLIPFDPDAAGLRLLLIDTRTRHALVESAYGSRRADCAAAAAALGLRSLRDAGTSRVAELGDSKLQRRARHVVTEVERVEAVAAFLDAGDLGEIGQCLTASHASLRDDFEVSCAELDAAVDAALAAGALGARMTGGGFGGSALALAPHGCVDAIAGALRTAYAERGWEPPRICTTRPSAGLRKIPEG